MILMSERGQTKETVYASAQGSSWIRDELDNVDFEAEHIDEFVTLIQDRDVIRLLNRYAVAFDRADENFLDYQVVRDVIRQTANLDVAAAFDEGNVSRLQALVGLVNQQNTQTDALARLLDELQREAFIGVIAGKPNTGKTHFGLWLCQLWLTVHGLDPGHIVTNVPVDHPDVVVVDNEPDLKDAMAEIDGPVIALVDEFGTSGGSSKGKREAEHLVNFCKQIRKKPYYGNLIGIGHAKKDVDNELREIVDFAFSKPGKKRAEAYTDFSDGFRDEAFVVPSIPEIMFRYDDKIQPTFEFGVDEDEDDELTDEEMKEWYADKAQTLRNKGYDAGEIVEALDLPWKEDWVYKWTEPPDDD